MPTRFRTATLLSSGLRRVALLLVGGILTAAGALAATPNVVLIIADDQAWTDYGFMGHPAIDTPRLDRLSEQSLTYTRGYVPTSLCAPSLASIITGLYPHEHGYVGNDPARTPGAPRGPGASDPGRDERRARLIAKADDWPTLPRRLAERGYLSLQTGKWWLGSYKRGGFTHGMTRGFPEPGGRHGDDGLRIGREGLDPIPAFLDEAKQAGRPFFLWYAPFLPHTPHNPPERLLAKYRDKVDSPSVAKYWAMCEWFDETCGELLDLLNERGVADDTIVVYACDNGWVNRRDRSAYAPRSKRSPYDGGLRTPVMVRWPDHVEPRRDETTLVSTIDIAPTVLAACGLAPGEELQGVSLLERERLIERDQAFGAIYEHDIVDLDRPAASLKHRWTVHGPWKLVLPYQQRLPDAAAELYHVAEDPHERREVAESHPEVVAELTDELDAWWTP
ncbi:sulfatase [Botrimarina sp.]|uniref:sulfatase family protein n=1 Tax=Botrimarina sp. TaxID=2795802 RepID=UPI0032EC3EF7